MFCIKYSDPNGYILIICSANYTRLFPGKKIENFFIGKKKFFFQTGLMKIEEYWF